MRIVVFQTPEERALGLQHRSPIEADTLFVFPDIRPGAVFHSRNVREPFDLAFLSFDDIILYQDAIVPEEGIAVAPQGTWKALEAKRGSFGRWGFRQGYRVRIPGLALAPQLPG